MIIERAKTYLILALALALAGTALYAQGSHQAMKRAHAERDRAEAEKARLRDLVNSQNAELDTLRKRVDFWIAERDRLAEANREAVLEAERRAQQAQQQADEYLRRLDNLTGDECAVLDMDICPAARDY